MDDATTHRERMTEVRRSAEDQPPEDAPVVDVGRAKHARMHMAGQGSDVTFTAVTDRVINPARVVVLFFLVATVLAVVLAKGVLWGIAAGVVASVLVKSFGESVRCGPESWARCTG